MPLAIASARVADGRAQHAAYLDYLRTTGRGNTAYWTAARTFFSRWPDPYDWADEPLEVKLSANGPTRPLITFLILHGRLQPGCDYLLERKFSTIWRELQGTPISADLDRFLAAAAELGFSQRVSVAVASQVPARLLIQTGRRMDRLRPSDLQDFAAACRERAERTGRSWSHYKAALGNTHRVLFHLQILPAQPRAGAGPLAFADRLEDVAPPIRAALVAYLERKRATCVPKTVSSLASRLMHFGVFLAQAD